MRHRRRSNVNFTGVVSDLCQCTFLATMEQIGNVYKTLFLMGYKPLLVFSTWQVFQLFFIKTFLNSFIIR